MFEKRENIKLLTRGNDLGDCADLELIWVNPGSFEAGISQYAPSAGMERAFEVELTQGFWLGKYPITNYHWDCYVAQTSRTNRKYCDRPKLDVNWFEAVKYCGLVNSRFKNELPFGYNFSLPTEIQWEFAARSGGEDKVILPPINLNEIDDLGWFKENNEQELKPVGLKKPNSWGFHDLIGNGTEWCCNSFLEYPKMKVTDWPSCDKGESTLKVRRSSSERATCHDPSFRQTFRIYSDPKVNAGFRLALIPSPQ